MRPNETSNENAGPVARPEGGVPLGTEGATDPDLYRRIVGRSPAEVVGSPA